MRVMITGSRGQIGQSLRRVLPENWELIATDSRTLDITQADAVEAMISNFQPDVLVNTAGYTNVEQAEEDVEKAFLINATGVLNLAQSAQKHGARLIYFSSDYVFDGKQQTPYQESAIPCPINVYGQSKLAGEVLALSASAATLIIRTSGVFSEYGHNFVQEILAKLRAKESISVVDDQICCPTYAGDLAEMVVTLIEDYPSARGLIHYCSQEAVSWYEFACRIAQTAGLDTSLIQVAKSTGQNVKRPAYSVLEGVQTSQYHRVPMSLERSLICCLD